MLIWVLDLKLLGKYAQYADPQESLEDSSAAPVVEGYLRLGMGKPFGLGLVQVTHTPLEIVKPLPERILTRLDLLTTTSLEGCLGAPSDYAFDPSENWNGFSAGGNQPEALSGTPWCKAFLQVVCRLSGKTEVRYMKLSETNATTRPTKQGIPTRDMHSLHVPSLTIAGQRL